MAAGLLELEAEPARATPQLVNAVLFDATTAFLVIFAMVVSLVLPMHLFRRLLDGRGALPADKRCARHDA